MKHSLKHSSARLIALAAILTAAPMAAWAATAPNLGTASAFSVLGGTAVSTTGTTIVGDVGSAGAVTLTGTTINGNLVYTGVLANTGSTISGTSTQPLNPQVITDLNSAWTSVQNMQCTDTTTLANATIGTMTLTPGVYCTNTALTATNATLTLDAQNNPNAVWIFKIGAALTGTNFSVVMINGGLPCNVYWVPGADVTLSSLAFSGNILAGANGPGYTAGGSITMTGGTLTGRALANTAVSMTVPGIVGCAALSGGGTGSSSCKDNDHGDHDNNGHHEHEKCNQGVGNGSEGCDPGHSDKHNPWGSNDENGGKPGDPGRKGGNK